MDRARLLAWADSHAAWSADAWARGDAVAWSSTFADDVVADIRRRMGPESYRGVADLIETAWGLREFFPEDDVTVVDVTPPSVILYGIRMRDRVGNYVGILIAHRIDASGRIAELVVFDDDAPPDGVRAGVAELAERAGRAMYPGGS